MSTGFIYRNPEGDVVTLRVNGVELNRWTQYSFNSNFETPTDAWSFTIADDEMTDSIVRAIYPGARVELSVNGLVQGHGFIDEIAATAERNSGTEWKISGRDTLSPVVDSHIDPRVQFKPGDTLEDIIERAFDGFGFEDFYFDNEANRAVMLGKSKPSKATKPGKKKGRGGKKTNPLRPNQHEGCFAFAARIAERHGLWIWATADGTGIVVDQPEYGQAPSHRLFRNSRDSNILTGGPTYSVKDQPSVIVADGVGGGGEGQHSKLRVLCANPITGINPDGTPTALVQSIKLQNADAKEVFFDTSTLARDRFSLQDPNVRQVAVAAGRPLYMHDESSRTIEELEAYVRREMSAKLRHYLTVPYHVEGHGLYDEAGTFTPFAVDTIVEVDDQATGFRGALWCIGRTFTKSRGGGTETSLDLIMPGALQYGGSSK